MQTKINPIKHSKHNDFHVLSALEQDLLTLLSIRPLYGLEFVEAINAASDGRRTLQVGSLYPTLHRLEKDNMIQGHWSDSTSSGARRKYYTITDLGRQILETTTIYRQNLLKWAHTDTFRECGSGVELIQKGFPEDVDLAAKLDVSDCVPTLINKAYIKQPV